MTDDREHASDDSRDLGETDGPMEDALEKSFTAQVEEGTQRLSRPWHVVLLTGFMAGTEVSMGVLAFLAVLHETGDHLLAGLAFSIGFLALLMGRSELFTEGFLVPVVTVAAKRATVGQLLKLWGGTLVANLAGGWLIMWLVVLAFPDFHADLVESATTFAAASVDSETIALAIIAGATMTLLTRMQHGTDEMIGKMVAAVAVAFLLAGTQMFHSILDSMLIFGAIHTGDASFGYGDWAQFMLLVVPLNMVGGLGLVTMLRLIRGKDRLEEERNDEETSVRD